MFNSGITAKSFIDTLKAEIDLTSATIITDNSYVRWLNTVEQTVYREIIKELRKTVLNSNLTSPIPITSLAPASGEEQPIFEDIYKIYAGDVELIPQSMVGGFVFTTTNAYWKDSTNIGYELTSGTTPSTVTVFYYVRPLRKTVTQAGISTENVAFPAEWLEIAASRIRGEAYKLANEDATAAKWLNDYNIAVEQFKVWMESKRVVYGE